MCIKCICMQTYVGMCTLIYCICMHAHFHLKYTTVELNFVHRNQLEVAICYLYKRGKVWVANQRGRLLKNATWLCCVPAVILAYIYMILFVHILLCMYVCTLAFFYVCLYIRLWPVSLVLKLQVLCSILTSFLADCLEWKCHQQTI